MAAALSFGCKRGCWGWLLEEGPVADGSGVGSSMVGSEGGAVCSDKGVVKPMGSFRGAFSLPLFLGLPTLCGLLHL